MCEETKLDVLSRLLTSVVLDYIKDDIFEKLNFAERRLIGGKF
jgi:hypothetical protein